MREPHPGGHPVAPLPTLCSVVTGSAASSHGRPPGGHLGWAELRSSPAQTAWAQPQLSPCRTEAHGAQHHGRHRPHTSLGTELTSSRRHGVWSAHTEWGPGRATCKDVSSVTWFHQVTKSHQKEVSLFRSMAAKMQNVFNSNVRTSPCCSPLMS